MSVSADSKIRVNGLVTSWNSLELEIDGVPYEGITSISFGQTRERQFIYGMRKSGPPLGRAAGKYTPGNIKIKFLPDTWKLVRLALAARGLEEGGVGYSEFEFSLVLSAYEVGGVPVVFAATGCIIVEEADSFDEGNDALVTEVTIMPMLCGQDALSLAARHF